MPHIWKPRSTDPLPDDLASMARQLEISPTLAAILFRRGLEDVQSMDLFLSPMLRHMADPSLLPGLDQAAETLARSIDRGDTLCIWGDYDVDGITSTALLTDFFAHKGVQARHHLPNRLHEGYGLSMAGVERLAEEGVKTLLTVDCGISDVEPVARAHELGMTVVVTDHHMPPEVLPEADALCDPRLSEDNPFTNLAGVGVAFMLAVRLNRILPGDVDLRTVLDLVALGTIADVVPLTGQNRILVKNGLLHIKEAKRPGIAALKIVSDYDQFAELGAGQIGYNLAPRINAAGRMGDPAKGLDLLLAPDLGTASPLADELNRVNIERRRMEQEITDEALAQAVSMGDKAGLVLHADHWHPGIIGIVASRVVERFYRPVMLLSGDGQGEGEAALLKGSGRSISEFDIHAGLTSMASLFEAFGGHRLAAGLSIKPENLDMFRAMFHEAVVRELGPEPLTPTLKVDGELEFGDITTTLLHELELLQPFGMGNAEPVFTSTPLVVDTHKAFGREREHVKLTLKDAATGARLEGKAWRQGDRLTREVRGKIMSFAFTPRIDRYTGVPRIELNIRDWHFDR